MESGVFPVHVYACMNSSTAHAAQLPEPTVLPKPSFPTNGIVISSATGSSASGGASGSIAQPESTCSTGILVTTINRPWYGVFFRTLTIHSQALNHSALARALPRASRERLFLMAGSAVALDLVSVSTLCGTNWCSIAGPLAFTALVAFILLASTLTCCVCAEHARHASFDWLDTLAQKLPVCHRDGGKGGVAGSSHAQLAPPSPRGREHKREDTLVTAETDGSVSAGWAPLQPSADANTRVVSGGTYRAVATTGSDESGVMFRRTGAPANRSTAITMVYDTDSDAADTQPLVGKAGP